MDEFKLLSSGVAYNRGKKSKTLRFAQQKDSNVVLNTSSNVFNFFGESRSEHKEPNPTKNIPKIQEESHQVEELEELEWFTSEEEVHLYRRRHHIRVHSSGKSKQDTTSLSPWPIKRFKDLEIHYNVDPWIVQNVLDNFQYASPSSIQKQAIPYILTGQPLLASAPTGSGKTLAFLLPLIAMMKAPSKSFLRALVIVPSRELAVQTVREFDVLRGHKNFKCRILERQTAEQTHQKRRLDLGVATPLKLIQLLRDDQISLHDTKHIVLDEADRLLDMGFAPQIDEIVSYADVDSIQLLLFSATLPDSVVALAETLITGATRIAVGTPMAAASEIKQQLMFVTKEEGKLATFRQLVVERKICPPTLIFLQSIDRAKQLFQELIFDGIFADVIHAERTKSERDNIIQGFREKKIWVLICSDLMARGVDFKGVQVVINWDLPQSAAAYIHRIGRTGRAGREGLAITFFTLDDVKYLPPVISVMRQSGCSIPEWMLRVKKPNKKEKKKFEKRGVVRRHISTIVGESGSTEAPSRKNSNKKWKAVKHFGIAKQKKTEILPKV